MKVHKCRMRPNRYGGFNTGTVCGRMSDQCEDGINSTEDWDKVTCKFCLRYKPDTGAEIVKIPCGTCGRSVPDHTNEEAQACVEARHKGTR